MSRVETKLEVVTIPVSDVDRAKRFYEGLGWRVDADFSKGDWRVVQFTPEPGVVLAPAWGPAEGRNGLAITVHDVGLACLTEGPF